MTLDKNVENALADARRRAEKGDAGFTTFLQSAQDYARRVGQDVSAQVAEIRALVKI